MSLVRTLEEIRRERGDDIHGFVLMVTGALPADPDTARQICGVIKGSVDTFLSELERTTELGVEVTGLQLRMERSEVYIREGLPNAR